MWCGDSGVRVVVLEYRDEYKGMLVPTYAPIHVCEHHRDQMHRYMLEVARRSGATLALFLAVITAVVCGGVSGINVIAAAGLVLLGVWSALLPYATPETVRWLGAERSQALVRSLGAVVLVVGVVWSAYTLVVERAG